MNGFASAATGGIHSTSILLLASFAMIGWIAVPQ